MEGNDLQRDGVARVLLWGAVLLAVAAGMRYGLLENGLLPRDCLAPGSPVAPCAFKTALVQSFLHQRLGWASLVLGGLAFATAGRRLAWAGWLSGLSGLILYSYEPAAVGAMLALLVLARPRGEQRH